MTMEASYMKLTIVTVMAFATLSSAHAGNSQGASASSRCSSCNGMRDLAMQFDRLDHSVRADFRKGARELMPQVLRYLDAFRMKLGKPSIEEFSGLVSLISSALPYEETSTLADDLATMIGGYPKLKVAYEATLPKISEICRRKLLSSLVAEFLCGDVVDRPGANQRPGCQPVPDFDFAACLAKKRQPNQAKAIKSGPTHPAK